MEVKFLQAEENNNFAVLEYKSVKMKDQNTLHLIHGNEGDGFYSCAFEVTGSSEEIKVIKEFCKKLTEAK